MSTRPTLLALAFCVAALLPAAAGAAPAWTFNAGLLHSTGVSPKPDFTYPAFPYLSGGLQIGGPFIVGLRAELAHDIFFGRTELFAHAFAGIQIRSDDARFAVTAEAGGHDYEDVGNSIARPYSSPTTILPSIGGQVQYGTLGGPLRNRYAGFSAFFRHDLESATITSIGADTDGFFGSPGGPVPFRLGGNTIGVALDLTMLLGQ